MPAGSAVISRHKEDQAVSKRKLRWSWGAVLATVAIVSATVLAKAAGPPAGPADAPAQQSVEWAHWGGDERSSRYSSLDQINASNVGQLEVVTIVTLAVYLAALLILSLVAVTQLWPGSQHLSDNESRVRILSRSTTLTREGHHLIIVLCMGLLGASADSLRWLGDEVRQETFVKVAALAYVFRPWFGCVIAIFFYGMLRGGLVSGPGGSREINAYGLAGVSGLAGFSATQLINRLLAAVP